MQTDIQIDRQLENMEETPKAAALEDFTDTVDLSNACREFYQSRRKVAETVKEKLAASGRQQQKIKTTSMDTAILKLKTEMVRIFFTVLDLLCLLRRYL